MSASEEDLGTLHGLLANYLTRKVEGAIEDLDKEPEAESFVLPRTLGAAELNACLGLLKNSNITCKRNVGSELDALDEALSRSRKGKVGRPTDADLQDAIEAANYQGVH